MWHCLVRTVIYAITSVIYLTADKRSIKISSKEEVRMLRKLSSTILLLSMLAVLIMGCAPVAPGSAPAAGASAGAATNGSSSNDVVTLDYYWIGNGDTDQRPLVEAAVNDYVGPLLGVKVVFHIIGWGNWATTAVTGIQAGEKMDIFFTA